MSKIINIKPQINPEGYLEDNIQISKKLNNVVLENITSIQIDHSNFERSDIELLNDIIENHKILSEKKSISKESFIINDMEINELKRIIQRIMPDISFIDINIGFFQNKKKLVYILRVYKFEPTSICNFRCVMCYQSDKSF